MMSPKRFEEIKLMVDAALDYGPHAIIPSSGRLVHALRDAVAEIEELQAQLNLNPAPPCRACREDDHVNACGGPESGCGCAARGHE